MKHTDRLRTVSESAQKKFLADIRQGRIRSGQEAADRYNVTPQTIWVWLRRARDAGITIATRTGGAWLIVGKTK